MTDIRARLAEQRRERVLKLETVVHAHSVLQDAKEAYDEALMEAHSVGVSNTAIAKEIGRSETSVRLYIKRRLAEWPTPPREVV